MSDLTSQDIDAVCGMVNDLCGIYWDESKAYLIESRLQNIVQEHSCTNYHDLVRKVRAEIVPGLKAQVVDAITTNETLWFRDSSPFEALRHKLIPEMIDEKVGTVFPRRFRIWSAACSTGQEVYSIAMTLAELLPDYLNWDIQIHGTDISPAAVEQASRGIYNSLEIGRGMDPLLLRKYFVQEGNTWKVSDSLRSMCKFSPRNLHDCFHALGQFDIVFCRNVAIYFNDEDRKSLFERAAKILTPNGWLFVGSAESLAYLGSNWQPQQHCRSNCYRPNQEREAFVK